MAYACPVCDEPQVDATHLADHVAFTAITGDDAHEEWLDETVADWADLGQDELAEVVVDHAEATDFPLEMDENASGPDPQAADGHEHASGRGHAGDRVEQSHAQAHERDRGGPPASRAPTADDGDVQDVLATARELTRRMQDGEETSDDGGDEDSTSADADTDESGDANRSDNETQ